MSDIILMEAGEHGGNPLTTAYCYR